MPIKRRTVKRAAYSITAEAVAAFSAGDGAALARLWGLKPWQVSPTEATGACPWPKGSAGASWWPLALELRADLLEAAGGDHAG